MTDLIPGIVKPADRPQPAETPINQRPTPQPTDQLNGTHNQTTPQNPVDWHPRQRTTPSKSVGKVTTISGGKVQRQLNKLQRNTAPHRRLEAFWDDDIEFYIRPNGSIYEEGNDRPIETGLRTDLTEQQYIEIIADILRHISE